MHTTQFFYACKAQTATITGQEPDGQALLEWPSNFGGSNDLVKVRLSPISQSITRMT
jgi:hypothetical protein